MTKTFRRRGMGVGPQGGIRPAFGGATWGQTVSPIAPQPIQVSPSTTVTQTNPGYRSWRGQNGQNQNQNLQWGQGQQNGWSGGQSSAQASQATMQAFYAALSQAVSSGVVSTTQAAQLESQAAGQNDQAVQQLILQINNMLITTPSAALATATGATAAAATTSAASTSWWSGSTTLFGTTVSNPVIAIGAGLIAVVGYALFRKK